MQTGWLLAEREDVSRLQRVRRPRVAMRAVECSAVQRCAIGVSVRRLQAGRVQRDEYKRVNGPN
jgi:hypothetical protein